MKNAILVIVALILPFSVIAQENLGLLQAEAAAGLKAKFFEKSYAQGIEKGTQLVSEFPDSPEVVAWYVANLALGNQSEKALEVAEGIYEKYPEDPWSSFALVRALASHGERGGESLEKMDEMVAMNPDNQYFIWLKGAAISNQKGREEALVYLNEVIDDFPESIPVLSLRASSLMETSYQKLSEEGMLERFNEGRNTYAQIREINPNWIDAYYRPAIYLEQSGNPSDAFGLISEASSITTSLTIHSYYWRLVMVQDTLNREVKAEMISSDIEYILENTPESAQLLYTVASQFGQVGNSEKQKELEEKILNEYSDDVYSEWVLVGRYRAFADEHRTELIEKDSAVTAEYEAMLWAYINKPEHIRETLIGDAYRNIYYLKTQSDEIDPEELLEVVNGMAEHEGINVATTHGSAPEFLAEKTGYYERAKELAREGVGLAEKRIESQREFFDTEEDYQRAKASYTGRIVESLGWIYFHEGKLDSAELHLAKAFSLNSENPQTIYRMGQLYEEKGDLKKAEDYYLQGMGLTFNGENPNEEALKEVYIKQNGSEELFDEYLTKATSDGLEQRKEKVLNEVIEDPELMASFDLLNIDESRLTSEELEGKIAIINFWGIWCGPCVKEMPDIQKLHEKYKDDPDVVVLTINNDPDIDKVREWMAEKEYDFVVLRDDGYLGKEGVYVFPTTWFTSEDSEIGFIKEGYTKELVEEFSWRVDYLASIE